MTGAGTSYENNMKAKCRHRHWMQVGHQVIGWTSDHRIRQLRQLRPLRPLRQLIKYKKRLD
jgi:hypothetical protein